MKKIFFLLLVFILPTGIFFSYKKEKSCDGCVNGNKPPIAVAGPDQVITLPTDSVSLNGSASSDPDGKISEWRWQKISGPASFNVANLSNAKTGVAGIYQFELTIRDDEGLQEKDTMQITVDDPRIHQLPIANTGPDQSIIQPTNSINFDGSASTDPDNNITSYLWTKISGSSSLNITNAHIVQPLVTNLFSSPKLYL